MDFKPLIALALLLPATAWAEDVQYPPRRAGLWEGTVKIGERSTPSKYCVDAATDRKLMEMGNQKLKQMGGQVSVKVDGSIIHVSAVSKVGDRTMTMEQTLTFNGDAQVTGIGHTSFDPPFPQAAGKAMPGEMQIEQHWTGACPADMKPGDVITNGQKINVADAMAR